MLRILLVLLVVLGSSVSSYGHDCEQNSPCWHDFPLNSIIHVGELCMDVAEAEFSKALHGYSAYNWDIKDGSVFTKVRWKDKTKGILQYWGNLLKLKDADGQWIPMEYTCDYSFGNMEHFQVQVFQKEESSAGP